MERLQSPAEGTVPNLKASGWKKIRGNLCLVEIPQAQGSNSEEPNGRHNGTPAHRYDLRKSEPEPSKRKTESKGTEFIIGETSFEELVRDVVGELYSGGAWEDRSKIRFAREAIKALQTSSEDYLVTLLRDCQVVATKAKRYTVIPEDIETVLRLRKDPHLPLPGGYLAE